MSGSENLNKTTSQILSRLSIIFAWLSFTLMEANFFFFLKDPFLEDPFLKDEKALAEHIIFRR